MTGRDLSLLFYNDIISPKIRSLPTTISNRIQIGFLGEGSEVSNFDDTLSQDHNFVPRVIIFYDDDLESEKVETFQKEIFKDLPNVFLGFPVDLRGHAKSIEIHPRVQFLKKYLGVQSWPLQTTDWLTIEEQRCFELTAGVVYFDPLERLSNELKAIEYFPDEIRSFLMLQCWIRLSEGEAISRSALRRDVISSNFYKTLICYYAIKLLHLIHRKYCPYKKWMGRSLRSLPDSAPFFELIEQIASENDFTQLIHKIRQLYGDLGMLSLKEYAVNEGNWWIERDLYLLNFNYEKIFTSIQKTIPSSLSNLQDISPPSMWGLLFDYSTTYFKAIINSHAKLTREGP